MNSDTYSISVPLFVVEDQFRKVCEEMGIQNAIRMVGLAISGGRDSVCAAYLLNALHIPFVMVHCNYHLRGSDSDRDEQLVTDLESRLEYCQSLHIEHFDTNTLHKESKLSIQELTRELRYSYFDTLHKREVFDKLITAHHADDNVETLLINLGRGSGLRGLRGIPNQRDYIVRPLLHFERADIDRYIEDHQISYRDDRSNATTYYLRNKFRNIILPVIDENIPEFKDGVYRSLDLLNRQFELYEHLIKQERKYLIDNETHDPFTSIRIERLMTYPQPGVMLYHLVDSYGFLPSQCEDIIQSIQQNGLSGKHVLSPSHRMVIDRDHLIIEAVSSKSEAVFIDGPGIYHFGSYIIEISVADEVRFSNDPNKEYLSLDLEEGIELRTWSAGDHIYPLGLNGKQLISDFYINNKFSLAQKEQTPLLVRNKEVIWVVGHRISERYKYREDQPTYRLVVSREQNRN